MAVILSNDHRDDGSLSTSSMMRSTDEWLAIHELPAHYLSDSNVGLSRLSVCVTLKLTERWLRVLKCQFRRSYMHMNSHEFNVRHMGCS